MRAAGEQVDQDYLFYKMQSVHTELIRLINLIRLIKITYDTKCNQCTQSFPKQVDIVDLRAETNVISKLGREQGSAFRKSSESQTDAAEVTKKSALSDSMSKSLLSSLPGCRF